MATMNFNPKNLSTEEKRAEILRLLNDPTLTEAQAIGLQAKLTDVLEDKRDEDSAGSTKLSNAGIVADKKWQEDRREKDRANQRHQQNHGDRRNSILGAGQAHGAGLITAITAATAGTINDLYHAYHEWKVEDTYKRDLQEHGAIFGEPDEAAKRALTEHRQKYWRSKSMLYRKDLS